MTAQVRPNASARRFVLPAFALLAVLTAAILLYSATRVVSISGKSESFVLERGQIRMGILMIGDGASASFREGSYWIGPVVSKAGSLTVGRGATINGPVALFSDPLRLGEKATVRGSIALFSGGLTLERGASVRGNAVLFSGPLSLGSEASVLRNAILFSGPVSIGRDASIGGRTIAFSGPVELQEKALLRGDAVLFSGPLSLGPEALLRGDAVLFSGPLRLGSDATVYGKVLAIAGGLDLGPRAVLHDGAVTFSGDVHLSPGAQVRQDVILAEGNATLDSASTIAGILYLTPEETSQRGRLIAADESVAISGGVVRPHDIESIATRNIEGWLLLRLLRLAALPLIGLGLLVGLVVFLVWRVGSRKARPGAGTSLPEMNLQPTAPGAVSGRHPEMGKMSQPPRGA